MDSANFADNRWKPYGAAETSIEYCIYHTPSSESCADVIASLRRDTVSFYFLWILHDDLGNGSNSRWGVERHHGPKYNPSSRSEIPKTMRLQLPQMILTVKLSQAKKQKKQFVLKKS